MKKLLTLTVLALALTLAWPSVAHAESRIQLSANGGVGIGGMPTLDNEHPLLSMGFQITWHTTSWLELGMRINASVALVEDSGGDEYCGGPVPPHGEFVQDDCGYETDPTLVWHSLFVTRFHIGSRVRATLGLGLGHFYYLPGPAVAADLEVILVRHGRHELSIRAGGDFTAIMGMIPYMSAHAGLAWSF